MATTLKPIGHEDRLTIVDHLDELRTRLVVCVATLVIAFGFCFWQNAALIDVLDEPLKDSTPTAQEQRESGGRLNQVAIAQLQVQKSFTAIGRSLALLARSESFPAADQRQLAAAAEQVVQAARALPNTIPERRPITTGVGEPFTVTLTIAAYFALLFSLPILLYQAYAFVLPAFSPHERKVALPTMLMVPLLFLGGVAFGYFLVLPPAISFLQNFNDESFDVLLQARDYYRFSVLGVL